VNVLRTDFRLMAQRIQFVREIRAMHRCEDCRAIAGQPHPETGAATRLQVVRANRDGRWSILNMLCLCQVCRYRRRRAELFKQAAR